MADRNRPTSSGVFQWEKLARTVPVSTVPAVRWAKGAQWSPARTAMSRSARAAARLSGSCPSAVKETTPV